MEWVETTGKSLLEAKSLALDRLGVDESDAEFDILDEPRPGLFGRMRGEARVRARVRPTHPRPKVERRRGRKAAGLASEASDGSGESVEQATTRSAAPAGRKQAAKVGAAPRASRAEKSAADKGLDDKDLAEAGANRPASRPAPARTKSRTTRSVEQEEPIMSEIPEAVSSGDRVDEAPAAAEFLQGLLAAIGATGTVETSVVDDDVEVTVEGADLGLLIGPRGATLQAVQELTRLAVQQRREGARGAWIHVDVSGYRAKRREALARFTTQVAQQVVDSGVARALEPMSAADRKVVHDTAGDLGGVRTTSEGEDPDRRVVIHPAVD